MKTKTPIIIKIWKENEKHELEIQTKETKTVKCLMSHLSSAQQDKNEMLSVLVPIASWVQNQ